MSLFGSSFWKRVSKSPNKAFELMQQDGCWFFDQKPSGYKWGDILGPFKLYVPSQGRTVTIYALESKIDASQDKIIKAMSGAEEILMSDINIDALATQFEGRKFGELVLRHMKKQSVEQIVAAMRGTIERSLPPSIQDEIEDLIDNANSLAYKKEFWADDCGKILRFITSMVQKKLKEKGITPTEDNLFDVFNLLVMNFAYSAYKDPRMKKFISSSIGKGIFSRIFG